MRFLKEWLKMLFFICIGMLGLGLFGWIMDEIIVNIYAQLSITILIVSLLFAFMFYEN